LADAAVTKVPAGRAAGQVTMTLVKFSRAEPGEVAMYNTQPRPHSPADLALAPVIISIERNLARLRSSSDLEFELALILNDDASFYPDECDRARRIMNCAIRSVDLHGWAVSPTSDLQGLAVSRGEYSVSLMLGKQITNYIEHGVPTWP
jgi:hypothetical protein